MASAFGMAITNLTSKVGILSRKACIRLATETGEKVIARKYELGRNLNTEELEQVFAEVLPKRCRPKIITTETKVRECMQRDGYNEKQIDAQIAGCKKNYMAAATVFNGTKKLPIYIPKDGESWIPETLKPYLDLMVPANVAHETEHALEKNCRIFDIFKRKVSGIKKFFGKLFDKNYMEKLNNREVAVHNFEGEMQKSLSPIVKKGEVKMSCEPTVESLSEKLGGDGKLVEILRKMMRENYASGINKGSEQNKRFKLISYWMDMERPAYEVTGKMEGKIFGLQEGEHAVNTGVAKAYEVARSIAKQERRTYWKNKFLCRLKKPNIYLSDKDILRHAANNEEKQILSKIIKDLSVEQKQEFIKVLSSFEGQPNAIKNLNQFLNDTTDNGRCLWNIYDLKYLEGIDTELLKNPDLIKIARLSADSANSSPAFASALKSVAESKPDSIRKFAKIADTKETTEIKSAYISPKRIEQLKKVVGSSELSEKIETTVKIESPIIYDYRYEMLAYHIDSPVFSELKAFTDIQVNGKYPYKDIIGGINYLSPERIKINLEKAQKLAKEGKSIYDDICHEIDAVWEALVK